MADDPLIGQLSKFTPDAANLNRAALLYAAGKASARPNRRWQAMAGVLAATQLVTLGLFMIPVITPSAAPRRQMADSPSDRQSLPADFKTVEPASIDVWAWRESFFSEDGSLPPLSVTEPKMPDEPPLSYKGSSDWDLPN